MAAKSVAPEAWRNWVMDQFLSNTREFPITVAHELSADTLPHVLVQWDTYSSELKLGLLFSFLCVKRPQVKSLEHHLTEIIAKAGNDTDEWVHQISRMMRTYPSKGTLDIYRDDFVHQDARERLKALIEKVRHHGAHFHSADTPYVVFEISSAFSSASRILRPGKRTHEVQTQAKPKQDRSQALNSLLTALASPTEAPASILNSTTQNWPQNRANDIPQSRASVPPPIRPASTQTHTSSMFIPKRRTSTASYLRPANLPKPAQVNTGGAAETDGTGSPTEVYPRKTFQKTSKIRMLDMSDATAIIQNQQETKAKRLRDAEEAKELKKQETERRREERRREEEEKKILREKERAEKQRLREEAKQRKEKEKQEKEREKQERVASKTASQAGTTGHAPGGRKKKRVSEDVFIQEEAISDEELPHKASEMSITSPISPALPISQALETSPKTESISAEPEAETVKPESAIETAFSPLISNSSPTASAPQSKQAMLPSEKSIEHVPQSTENISTQEAVSEPSVQPTQNMLSQEQVNELISQVVDETHCNVLGQEDKATIIRFLDEQFRLGNYGNPDDGSQADRAGDDVRQIIMHETRLPPTHSGKLVFEFIVFEMNLTTGRWRKIKRKKTRKGRDHDDLHVMQQDEI